MNEERTITITTEEYKALVEAQIRLDMVIQVVKEDDRTYLSISKDDLRRMLGIKEEEEEDE